MFPEVEHRDRSKGRGTGWRITAPEGASNHGDTPFDGASCAGCRPVERAIRLVRLATLAHHRSLRSLSINRSPAPSEVEGLTTGRYAMPRARSMGSLMARRSRPSRTSGSADLQVGSRGRSPYLRAGRARGRARLLPSRDPPARRRLAWTLALPVRRPVSPVAADVGEKGVLAPGFISPFPPPCSVRPPAPPSGLPRNPRRRP